MGNDWVVHFVGLVDGEVNGVYLGRGDGDVLAQFLGGYGESAEVPASRRSGLEGCAIGGEGLEETQDGREVEWSCAD